jgi:hypothetical protein
MKTKHLWLAAGLMVGCSGTAGADMLSGTVTSVDTANQKVTLDLDGSDESATVRVADKNSVINLKTGTQVSMDAVQEVTGDWSSPIIQPLTVTNRPEAPNTQTATSGKY